VNLRQISYQGQSQADTPCGGFCRVVELRIEIEDALDSIPRDSDSVILNPDANVVVRALRRNRDFTAFRRVLRRVVQEVRQELDQPGGVSIDKNRIVRNSYGQPVPETLELRMRRLDSLVDDGSQLNRLLVDLQLTATDAGKVHQIIDYTR
jgi:hypothetical protein